MKNTKTTLLAVAVLFTIPLARGADPKAIWDKECASCHAKDGSGNTKMGKKVDVKDYRDPKVQATLQDDKATKTIKEGITENGKERMKPYAKFSDEEIKGLIAHMRSFKK